MRPEISTFIMFIVIMTGFFIANEKFLSARNIRIVMGITPEYIIVAIGIAILMISGAVSYTHLTLPTILRV